MYVEVNLYHFILMIVMQKYVGFVIFVLKIKKKY